MLVIPLLGSCNWVVCVFVAHSRIDSFHMDAGQVISRERTASNAKVEHIPCEIQFNGSAPVSSYFVVNDDNKIKEAMFRGRLLKGERVSLPEGINGIQIDDGISE